MMKDILICFILKFSTHRPAQESAVLRDYPTGRETGAALCRAGERAADDGALPRGKQTGTSCAQ